MPLLIGIDTLVVFPAIPVPVPMIPLADTKEKEYGPRPKLALGSLELAVVNEVTLIVEAEDVLLDVGASPLP